MLRSNTMKKMRTAASGGTRIAGVALALALAGPGTGGHAAAAAAAGYWKVAVGPYILCIPVPCPEMSNSCCGPFDLSGPVI